MFSKLFIFVTFFTCKDSDLLNKESKTSPERKSNNNNHRRNIEYKSNDTKSPAMSKTCNKEMSSNNTNSDQQQRQDHVGDRKLFFHGTTSLWMASSAWIITLIDNFLARQSYNFFILIIHLFNT